MSKKPAITKWDRVRAEVFARDKAICAYRGVSVWLFDLGAVPFAEEPWTDHIELASKGGSSDADNLICASVSANYVRNRNPSHPPHYFKEGRPTDAYFDDGFDVGPALHALLKANRQFHPSDWYFNQALAHVLGVVQQREYRWRGPDGRPYRRTAAYWLKAAERALARWRLVLDRADEDIGDFESRRLIRYPDARDTKVMLGLRTATDLHRIRQVAKSLQPIFSRNSKAYYGYLGCKDGNSRSRFARKVLRDGRVHPEIHRMVRQAQQYFGDLEGPLYVD